MESSTKEYLTSLKLYFEMQHFKAAPNPEFLMLFICVVLDVSQMTGLIIFLVLYIDKKGSWIGPICYRCS